MFVVAPSKPVLLPGLTGLRGVGALWVMGFHAQFGLGLPLLGVGFLGVDMFFILSGFVLSLAHGGDRWTKGGYAVFLRGRFARLFPLHWLALCAVMLALLAMPSIQADMPRLFEWPDLLASLVLVQGWGFGRSAVWNLPAWSLSAEWLVSIAFPAFAVAAARVRGPRLAVAGSLACLLGFAGFLAATNNPDPDVTARAGLVRAVCEFAAGCLLHRAHALGFRAGPAMAAAGCGALAAGLLLPGFSTLAVFGFPVLILLAARPGGAVSRVLSTRAMLFLGEVSFSVYLLHWIVLQVSDRLQAAWGIRGTMWALPWFCGVVGALLLLSWATFRMIEVPARRRLRQVRLPGAAPLPARRPLRAE